MRAFSAIVGLMFIGVVLLGNRGGSHSGTPVESTGGRSADTLPVTGETGRMIVTMPACQSEDALKVVFDAMMANDTLGKAEAVYPRMRTGECEVLVPGDRVSVLEVAVWRQTVRVRPEGRGVSYWMMHGGMERVR